MQNDDIEVNAYLSTLVNKRTKEENAKKTLKIKKEKPKEPIYKPREPMTTDSVKDISFFNEDLDEMDKELQESRELYSEIHSLYQDVTGGDYSPTRNLRDIAELAKTLVSARTATADIVNKRISAKKVIADINYRNSGGDVDNENDLTIQTARKILELASGNVAKEQTAFKADLRTKEGKKNKEEQDLLDKNVNSLIDKGVISLSKNDKLVGTQDHAVTRYDAEHEKFVAVDNRTGKIIPGFPEERLPSGSVARVTDNGVSLQNGENYAIYNELEFDNDYDDSGEA